jgi:hypothetical protein
MHIGKTQEQHKFQPLFVENWEEKEVKIGQKIQVEDILDGEEEMEEKESEKYFGDVISNDGRNLKNIQARVNKGVGIVKKILTMLDGIPFGKFYFEAAVILRNSLLVSSMLFNCEAWYNITKAEMDLFETVDLMLLRGILKAPKSTPKEMLFLELGLVPFREIVRQRRLGFLLYILNQNRESMIYRVFESQRRNRSKKDWVTTRGAENWYPGYPGYQTNQEPVRQNRVERMRNKLGQRPSKHKMLDNMTSVNCIYRERNRVLVDCWFFSMNSGRMSFKISSFHYMMIG